MRTSSRQDRCVVVGVVSWVLLASGCSTQQTAGYQEPRARAATTVAGTATTSASDGFTIAAAGDFLIHTPVAARARARGGGGTHFDFSSMLTRVRPVLSSADLAICHLETPLSADNRSITGFPLFNSPHEVADAARQAGFDSCSTASNHSLDQQASGVGSTLSWLDRAGLSHAGTARTPQEARRIETHTVRGVRLAHLAYTYGTNGIPVPAGKPWMVNFIDPVKILADAARARREGAAFIVVSVHWGEENQSRPTAAQRSLAERLLASEDIDLLLGCHAHVPQPVDRIAGKYVVYGMGNLLSNQSPAAGLPAATQDGQIIVAHVARRNDRYTVDRVTIVPTFCDVGSYVVWPVARALAEGGLPASLRSALGASLRRSRNVQATMARNGSGVVIG
jgi:poly-gamma-glutamate capsule biosynthesis protein CapA/YwtB (metallophosphatase superfamily)